MSNLLVTPLGTVSPYCKDEKNCPGFLIKHAENEQKILLDCGNGITRQLNLPNDLNDLSIIISHLHKDHFGDLYSLAYASYVYKKHGYLDNRIDVYYPSSPVNEVEAIEDYKILGSHYFNFIKYGGDTKLNIGGSDISFRENPHGYLSYSTKIVNEDTTIVYSGDTGYKFNSLERFAKDADLLICESSLLNEHGKSLTHLRARDAAKIANKANVKQLMLTHFWPDIDKGKYLDEAIEIFDNTIVAEEGQTLTLKKKS